MARKGNRQMGVARVASDEEVAILNMLLKEANQYELVLCYSPGSYSQLEIRFPQGEGNLLLNSTIPPKLSRPNWLLFLSNGSANDSTLYFSVAGNIAETSGNQVWELHLLEEGLWHNVEFWEYLFESFEERLQKLLEEGEAEIEIELP